MAALRWLAELSYEDADTFGAKAANLGELMRIGVPVPPGFAISADAYLDAMQEGGVRDELRAVLAGATAHVDDDPRVFAASAERLRALVRKAGLPSALRDAVLGAYHRLGDRVPVAVRSSAPGEDTAAFSFAGMHDTYTNVIGDDNLLDCVVECWTSLYGERVIAYRANNGGRAEPTLAIVVQVMVDADAAGVMFTADPTTRDVDRIVIEAGLGLGEVVMAGEVEPDMYVVAGRGSRLVEVRVGHQTHLARATAMGTVERVNLAPQHSRRRVLADDQVIALAQLGATVDAHAGRPQDIEWAISGPSTYVVQTRPITAVDVPSGEPLGAVGPELTRGLAAAPGVATGHVRILMSPEHWRRLNPGDVLVAPMANPEWLPAVRRSGALVTDSGGLTCHGAIVARELGVPCVVATRIGTTRLRDGELVTVDGTRGLVLAAAPMGA
jgi:pyruvate,water dikinase